MGRQRAGVQLITALTASRYGRKWDITREFSTRSTPKTALKACVGVSADAFLDISRLDEVDGVVPPPNFYVADPTKYMLFEDPLFETMGDDSQHFKLSPYYKKMTTVMEKHRDENPEFKKMFEFFVRLSAAVEKKWHLARERCQMHTRKGQGNGADAVRACAGDNSKNSGAQPCMGGLLDGYKQAVRL